MAHFAQLKIHALHSRPITTASSTCQHIFCRFGIDKSFKKHKKSRYKPSRSLTARTWKWMVRILISFWGPAYFQGLLLLVLGRVNRQVVIQFPTSLRFGHHPWQYHILSFKSRWFTSTTETQICFPGYLMEIIPSKKLWFTVYPKKVEGCIPMKLCLFPPHTTTISTKNEEPT